MNRIIHCIFSAMVVAAVSLVSSASYAAQSRYKPLENANDGGNILQQLQNPDTSRTTNTLRTKPVSEFKDPLVNAADKGNLSKVTRILNSGYPVNSRGVYDTTALMRAAIRGHTDIVQVLIEKGANVDATDITGMSALSYAVNADKIAIADYLMRSGANPSVLSEKQYLSLKQRARFSSEPLVKRQVRPEAINTTSMAGKVHPDHLKAFDKKKAIERKYNLIKWGVVGGVAAVGGGVAAYTLLDEDDDPPPFQSAIAPGSGNPSDYETAEYNNQYGLGNMGASTAYANGTAGTGVTVAVVDTGVRLNHADLIPNLVQGFNTVDNNTDANPAFLGDDHGTHVAGIVAATQNSGGMHGVAYEAKIMPIRAGDGFFGFFESDLGEALNYAANNGARVINNSWGSSQSIADPTLSRAIIEAAQPNILAGISNAVSKGAVTVFAAGNDGIVDTSVDAGLPVYFPEFKELFLAVVATDQSNNIASFSNRCGIAKDWCLAAPGVNINSTTDDGGYAENSGTSMAAPHVSGAVALLMAQFPGLTSEQVVDLLLSTATDLGVAGVDDVYGHGLVNLGEATKPQGGMSVPTGSSVGGGGSSLGTTSIVFSRAFGDAFGGTGLTVAALDSYLRAYNYDISQLTSKTDTSADVYQAFSSFGKSKFAREIQVNDNMQVAYSQGAEHTEDSMKYGYQQQHQVQKASFKAALHDGEIAANYNTPADEAFGYMAVSGSKENNKIGRDVAENPYLGLVQESRGASVTQEMGNGVKFKTGVFDGTGEASDTGITAAVMEVARNFGDNSSPVSSSFGIQAGILNEEETFLGTDASGAFSVDDNIYSYFVSTAGEIKLTDKARLFGSYSSGVTYVTPSTASLFDDISAIRSDSASFGIAYDGLYRKSDSLMFAFSQPLRVSSGTAGMTLPQGRDAAGNLFLNSSIVNLAPTGRELDFEVSYLVDLAEKTSIRSGFMHRMQPGHIKEAKSDDLVLLKVRHKF